MASSVPSGRGAFIVFEGLDRSGKSTQSARLLARLHAEGVRCVDAVWRFPERTTVVGELLNAAMSSGGNPSAGPVSLPPRALHLLFTANRWERNEQLRSLLSSGVSVIADRYSYSGVAYSVAAEGLPSAWCKQVEAGLIAADAVVYLRVSADDAAARRGYGKERYERVEMQRSIQTVFEEELVEDGRAVGEGGWAVVDGGAGRTIDEVGDDVWSAVNAVCSAVKLKPMRVLWE